MWRRQLKRLTGAGLIALLIAMAVAGPASAGPGAGGDDNGYSGTAATNGRGGGAGGGGGGNCTYVPASDNLAVAVHAEAVFGGIRHLYYSKFCDGVLQGAVWLPALAPGDVLVMARQMIERTLPEPSPLMVWPDAEFDWAYTQVPIDFRADPAHWQTFEDTATASSPIETVSVTIRAEPVSLSFQPGDPRAPQSVACGGSDPLATYNPHVPGACSYTFTNASSTAANGRQFVASFGITWNIRYWSTTHPGFAGSLAPITRETFFPIEVAEAKVVSITGVP